ncbi:MAG: hypothetical protein AB7U35_07930, partial [Sphingobium sp.]
MSINKNPVREILSFEQRLARHSVNGVTGLNSDPQDMCRMLTEEVHALLLTIGAAFDSDEPE